MKPIHWIVLIVVILLVFGSKRLPDMARSIGQSLRVLKEETKKLNSDDDKDASGDDAGERKD